MNKRAALNTKLAVKFSNQRQLIRAPVVFSDIMDIGDNIHTPYRSSGVIEKYRDIVSKGVS